VRGEPLPQDASHHEQDDEIRRNCAEPYVEGPVGRKEGNDRVDNVRPLGQNLGRDVNDEERQRTEREGTVHGLCHHPVPGRHDDPVGGQQAYHHRPGEGDEREHPGVEQHKVLCSSINVPAGLGGDQYE
jgi:hypothetical protein